MTERQPVHTVYGGAHLFRADTARRLGEIALAALDRHAPDAATFAEALGLDGDAAFHYTASLAITAAHQHMAHPVCDFAKHVMQVALAGTGVALSDGATNVLPVGDRKAVHRAWRLMYGHVRRSLAGGFYQGWDLHPAQLPVRYAAVYAFFLEGAEAAGARLRAFVDRAAQATLAGDVMDDAATGQGLLNYFLRALGCGALAPDEAERLSGLTLEELRSRSFSAILAARRG